MPKTESGIELEIEVTQSDIDLGWPGDCLKCPIAMAIQHANPDFWVRVLFSTCFLKPLDRASAETKRLLLPKQAREFIANIDSKSPTRTLAKPFTFLLEEIP